MKQYRVIYDNNQPRVKDCLWIKPVLGGFVAQLLNNGAWQPQKTTYPEVTNITAIPGALLSSLNCGDKVIKVTGNQKHLYNVSYKGEGVGQGICLTYVDAGLVETVSYDYTENGWVYNSTDRCTLEVDD